MKNPGYKIFAPASVGNAAVGFDCLGFALEEPGDYVIVRFSDEIEGLKITRITGAKGKLPYEIEKNTAGYAASQLLKHLGEEKRGIEMEIHKKMPFGSGLGSSAASAVAGAMAINELFDQPLEKPALLPFIMDGEELASGSRHADNIAPSLLGGFILMQNNEEFLYHKLPFVGGLCAAVLHPKVEILTKDARGILSEQVELKKHVEQSANLASFVVGMYKSNIDIIKESLKDIIIEPQRAKLIPHFSEVKETALENGALGCSISGAGPSIFALCQNDFIAKQVGAAMQNVFTKAKIESSLYISPINHEGAIKC